MARREAAYRVSRKIDKIIASGNTSGDEPTTPPPTGLPRSASTSSLESASVDSILASPSNPIKEESARKVLRQIVDSYAQPSTLLRTLIYGREEDENVDDGLKVINGIDELITDLVPDSQPSSKLSSSSDQISKVRFSASIDLQEEEIRKTEQELLDEEARLRKEEQELMKEEQEIEDDDDYLESSSPSPTPTSILSKAMEREKKSNNNNNNNTSNNTNKSNNIGTPVTSPKESNNNNTINNTATNKEVISPTIMRKSSSAPSSILKSVSSPSSSRRFLLHLVDRMKNSRSLALPLLQGKYFSGKDLIDWIGRHAGASSEDSDETMSPRPRERSQTVAAPGPKVAEQIGPDPESVNLAQQLFEAKLVIPLEPGPNFALGQAQNAYDPYQIFVYGSDLPSSVAAPPANIPPVKDTDFSLKILKSPTQCLFFHFYLDQFRLGHILSFHTEVEALKFRQNRKPSLSSQELSSRLTKIFDRYLSGKAPSRIRLNSNRDSNENGSNLSNASAQNNTATNSQKFEQLIFSFSEKKSDKDKDKILHELQNEVIHWLNVNHYTRFVRSTFFSTNLEMNELLYYYVLNKMRDPVYGFTFKEKKFKEVVYRQAVTGSDIIDWLLTFLAFETREAAANWIQIVSKSFHLNVLQQQIQQLQQSNSSPVLSYFGNSGGFPLNLLLFELEPDIKFKDDNNSFYGLQIPGKPSKTKIKSKRKTVKIGTGGNSARSMEKSTSFSAVTKTAATRNLKGNINKQSMSKRKILENFKEYKKEHPLAATPGANNNTESQSPPSTSPPPTLVRISSVTPNDSPRNSIENSDSLEKVLGSQILGSSLVLSRSASAALNTLNNTIESKNATSNTTSDSSKAKSSEESSSSLNSSKEQEHPEWKRCVDLFNDNPKKGVEAFIQAGILPRDASQVAAFLRRNKNLNKAKIGEYLGESNEFALQVLDMFIRQLDFGDLDFDVALRQLMNRFRLPGEAQKIDRILEKFAHEFYDQNPHSDFASADSAWALAFAAIMLNTDAHSSQVKKKMSKAAFIHNCRGINEGGNFPPELLEEIYDRITTDEIKLLDDGMGPVSGSSPLKKGWITAKISVGTKVLHKWRRFYFVLLPTVVLFYKKPGETEPVGKFDLLTLRILNAKLPIKDRKFCMQLQTIASEEEISRNSPGQSPQEQQLVDRARRKSVMKPNFVLEDAVNIVFSLTTEREQTSWGKILKKFIDKVRRGGASMSSSQLDLLSGEEAKS